MMSRWYSRARLFELRFSLHQGSPVKRLLFIPPHQRLPGMSQSHQRPAPREPQSIIKRASICCVPALTKPWIKCYVILFILLINLLVLLSSLSYEEMRLRNFKLSETAQIKSKLTLFYWVLLSLKPTTLGLCPHTAPSTTTPAQLVCWSPDS